MTSWNTRALIAADKKYIWHPFTPMVQWCADDHEPLVLVEGKGALLWDSEGREYIDGNSSIWTNIHGHNHPHINDAIKRQLDRVAHTSFLGFTNAPAIELAEAIVALFPPDSLSRVFYSDDGSTGIEAALRIALQFWELNGEPRKTFVAFKDAYHGDTAGAASLGASAMFQDGASPWNFPVRQVAEMSELDAMTNDEAGNIAAIVIEPMVQGAAGIKLWPKGTLQALRSWCDRSGALLIADEVMTGFGRTGKMFASEHEGVMPDIMVIAKALTGGYVPLAITLLTDQVFEPFLQSRPSTTLFYGHSYSGNAIGCAAAKASLEVFAREDVLVKLQAKIDLLHESLAPLRQLPWVRDVRQCGFVAGIEVIDPSNDRDTESLGAKICLAAREHGLLTRPIRDVIVLMPPFCINESQLRHAVRAIHSAITEVCERELASSL